MGTEDEIFEQKLQLLECQFLSGYAINSINWQKVTRNLSWEQQKKILDRTWGSELNQNFPTKRSYQLHFLKKLIENLEERSNEVHDEIYEAFCEIQCSEAIVEKFAFKHYCLNKFNAKFSLRESSSFVADGTTGLCSWQASLALSDWLLAHTDFVAEKSVVELGAGTGLCGFIAVKCCRVKDIVLSDGSSEVIALLRENLRRNFPAATEISFGSFKLNGHNIVASHLPWNTIEDAGKHTILKPDVILAADVVYDSSVFADLLKAIDFLFCQTSNKAKFILSTTLRNEETLNMFLKLLVSLDFNVEEKPVVSLENSNLFWDRSTPVKIFLITRILHKIKRIH